MCKGLMYNLSNETLISTHEGSVFALISKGAVVRHISTFPIRGKNSATDETAHCRDERLPVVYVCGRTFVIQGDAHVLSNNQARRKASCRNTAREFDLFGRVPAHDARTCVRDFEKAFAEHRSIGCSGFAGRPGVFDDQAERGNLVDPQPNDERGNWSDQPACVEAGRKFSQQVNKFQFIEAGFLREFAFL